MFCGSTGCALQFPVTGPSVGGPVPHVCHVVSGRAVSNNTDTEARVRFWHMYDVLVASAGIIGF